MQTIAVVNGGLHYLHLFPAREFQGKLGALLGNYHRAVTESLNQLRAHVGQSNGLVVWKTVNNVCDSGYQGAYKSALAHLRTQP